MVERHEKLLAVAYQKAGMSACNIYYQMDHPWWSQKELLKCAQFSFFLYQNMMSSLRSGLACFFFAARYFER